MVVLGLEKTDCSDDVFPVILTNGKVETLTV